MYNWQNWRTEKLLNVKFTAKNKIKKWTDIIKCIIHIEFKNRKVLFNVKFIVKYKQTKNV